MRAIPKNMFSDVHKTTVNTSRFERPKKPLDYFITVLYLLVEKYFNLLKLIEFLIAVLKLCSILHATQTLS